jgi:hypothetical protein
MFFLMLMRKVETIGKLPAMPYRMCPHRMILETLKPFALRAAYGKNKFTSRKHLIKLLVNQRPWPIFEQVMLIDFMYNSREIISGSNVFQEPFVATGAAKT